MRRAGIVVLLLCVAGGAESKPASRDSGAFSIVKKADAFESARGVAGEFTKAGIAFNRLYCLKDVPAFRSLARSPSGAAQLYGLCGLERLQDPVAPATRARLLKSKARTSIIVGDELPYPEGSVRELLQRPEFVGACSLLTGRELC